MKKIQTVVAQAKDKILSGIQQLLRAIEGSSTKKKLIVAAVLGVTLVSVSTAIMILAKTETSVQDNQQQVIESVLADGGDLIDANEKLGIETLPKSEEVEPAEVVTITNDAGDEVEVAPKVAETPNTNSNTVEVTKQQQEEYVAPKQVAETPKPVETPKPAVKTPKPAAVTTPKPVAETPKPAVKTPSVSTGYNADMTSKLMRMYTNANTNNSDVYSQHNICTPGFLSQFKSIAGQYCSGAISDPSAIKSVRGDYNVTDTRVFYTVVDSFSYGEVTGNDADSLFNAMYDKGARKGGCVSISCSYNGSTYVARFVYAKTGCVE